ncbi:MAG TPA: TOMM precursor leader peptide-binding protein, partial [Acidobacteriota bacterium]|nr:TOMM precursor leader peptide-binding protein [Acidobacteriota bacterium]
MITIPAFKSYVRIKVVPPDLCFFFHDIGYRVLQSLPISMIAPFINGRNSVANIAEKLKGKFTEFDIECVLLILQEEGLLQDASDHYDIDRTAFTDLLSITARAFENVIGKSKIIVKSFGLSAHSFDRILKDLGITLSDNGGVAVVLVDDYLRNELREFNEYAMKQKLRWILMKPIGSALWFGPAFVPGASPCWECLAHRLCENLRGQTFPDAMGPLGFKNRPTRAALTLAAIEMLRSLVGGNSEPLSIQTLDLKTMELSNHAVIRSDQCRFCSTKKKNTALNLRKEHTASGVIIEKYKHLIDPITGILDRVTTTEYYNTFYVTTVEHPFVLPPEQKYPPSLRLKRKSYGKGFTTEKSVTGAVCEAFERYSGIFRGDEPRIRASYNELKVDAIHPNVSMNFSDEQYLKRNELNLMNSGNHWIPAPFDKNSDIEWSPVWSLTYEKIRYVPTAYCYYGYPLAADERFCRADSNGNASGNTLEEAILHGFLEIVERDAVALWWFNKIPRPSINLDSLPLPYIEALRNQYKSRNRIITLFDITSDFKIPCFAAVSENKRSEFFFGFAAHFDPVIAASKALAEMNQFLETSGRKFEHAKFLRSGETAELKRTRMPKNITKCVRL